MFICFGFFVFFAFHSANRSRSHQQCICKAILLLSIISASINHLLDKNISFIFASHLHQIPNYIDANLKNNLFIGHLKTYYDEENKKFIYNRKLYPGISEKNYGLIVAKSLLNNNKLFIINSSIIFFLHS